MSPPRPGGTAPHVVVSDVERPVLDGGDRHHLERVRRVRVGDPLTVTDGAGRWRWCRFGDDLEPDGVVVADPAPHPAVEVCFALVKGERPELVVQKLTELGVDRIVAFVAARSVVRWDTTKREHATERWRRIAREAAMQSRRTWLPDVEVAPDFAAVVGRPGATAAALGGGPPDLSRPCVLIGPEGGWAPEEEARFPATMGLGPTVLRAETAAIAAASLLAALRAGSVAPAAGGA
jgi:16S rRNA (uracil1498-N3)-methyltransferase